MNMIPANRRWPSYAGLILLLAAALAGLTAAPVAQAKPDTASCNPLELVVEVDEATCGAGAIQCSDDGSGHTFLPASAANHNPVRIVALLTRNGVAVTGLAASNFFLSTNIGVAGGPSVLLCPSGGTGCGGGAGNLFTSSPDGLYMMFAHPGQPGINWRAGSYFPTLQVVLPDGTEARAIARINIPPAP